MGGSLLGVRRGKAMVRPPLPRVWRRERTLSRLERARKALEPEAERKKADGHTKIAELLYSTG